MTFKSRLSREDDQDMSKWVGRFDLRSVENRTFSSPEQLLSTDKMGEQQVLEEAQAELNKRMKALADPAALAMKATR